MDRVEKEKRLRRATGVPADEVARFLLLYEAVKDIEVEAAARERTQAGRDKE